VQICGPYETSTPPLALCNGSEMSLVINHTYEGRAPVVYAHAPAASGLGCTGVSFDISAAAGWTCVAVVARDRAGVRGNLGISPPLRVCRKVKESDCGGAAPGTILSPPVGLTCTSGCKLPESWSTPTMSRLLVR
jgi:hypothetical protein